METAATPADADSTTFDCIVSEYVLPDDTGVAFLERIRADRPELPFVIFTAEGSETVASEAISADVTEYMRKRSSLEQFELLAN
ncbi:MAG: response regulator [Halobacteriales archaeon]|nr:response regulator [Halobacteriales archaeon]